MNRGGGGEAENGTGSGRGRLQGYPNAAHSRQACGGVRLPAWLLECLAAPSLFPSAGAYFGSRSLLLSLFFAVGMGLFAGEIGVSIQHDGNHGAYSDWTSVGYIMGASLEIVGASRSEGPGLSKSNFSAA